MDDLPIVQDDNKVVIAAKAFFCLKAQRGEHCER